MHFLSFSLRFSKVCEVLVGSCYACNEPHTPASEGSELVIVTLTKDDIDAWSNAERLITISVAYGLQYDQLKGW